MRFLARLAHHPLADRQHELALFGQWEGNWVAYNVAHEIIDAAIVDPAEAPAQIRRWLARDGVAHLHARFAGHGCYACRIDRAE